MELWGQMLPHQPHPGLRPGSIAGPGDMQNFLALRSRRGGNAAGGTVYEERQGTPFVWGIENSGGMSSG